MNIYYLPIFYKNKSIILFFKNGYINFSSDIYYKYPEKLFTTIGCHPTRASNFTKSGNADEHLKKFKQLIELNKKKVVAIGEIGLG